MDDVRSPSSDDPANLAEFERNSMAQTPLPRRR